MNAWSSECEEATGTTDQTGAGWELQTKVLFSEVATESPAHVQQPVYTTAAWWLETPKKVQVMERLRRSILCWKWSGWMSCNIVRCYSQFCLHSLGLFLSFGIGGGEGGQECAPVHSEVEVYRSQCWLVTLSLQKWRNSCCVDMGPAHYSFLVLVKKTLWVCVHL